MRPACASASSALLASAFGISLTPACCSICLACASPRLRVAPPSCPRLPGCGGGGGGGGGGCVGRFFDGVSSAQSPLPHGGGRHKAGGDEPLVAFAEPVAH